MVGEVVLAVSVLEIMGVMEADGVTEGPFPMTCIVLFPRLDNGSSFFILIFAYMSLLNLIVISAKGKELLKKKKNKYKKISIDEPNTYFFFPSISRLCRMKVEGSGPKQ